MDVVFSVIPNEGISSVVTGNLRNILGFCNSLQLKIVIKIMGGSIKLILNLELRTRADERQTLIMTFDLPFLP